MRQRFLTFAVLGVILVGIAEWNLRSRSLDPLRKLNNFWLEFCVGNAEDRLSVPAVTVVRISDDYEPLSIGEEHPAAEDGRLSRLDFATILGFIGKLNPRSVAFLPIPSFDENHVLNQTDIVPLKDAAMQLPRLIVAANVSDDGEDAKEKEPLPFEELTVEGDPSGILAFTRTVRYPDPQLLANADPAFKSIESARDLQAGGVLRIPLVANYRGKIVPSLVLSAVARHAGVGPEKIVVDLSGKRPLVRLGEFRDIPIEPDGTFVVPAHAGIRRGLSGLETAEDGTVESRLYFTSLTVDELAYTGEEEDEVAKRILSSLQPKFDSLARNLVVVGFDRTADRRIETGSGPMLSETILLSRAIATIQSGRFIEWWPMWARWIAILALAVLAALLLRLRGAKFVGGWLLAVLIFFGACVMIFRATLTWTPPFFAFALFAVLLLVGLLVPGSSRNEQATES